MAENTSSKNTVSLQVKGPEDKGFRTVMNYSSKNAVREAHAHADLFSKKIKKHEFRVVKQGETVTKSEPTVIPARTKPTTGATRIAPKAAQKPAPKAPAKKAPAKNITADLTKIGKK